MIDNAKPCGTNKSDSYFSEFSIVNFYIKDTDLL